MNRIRFLMIGGFLGAGKTTAIARLARYLIDRGHRVGLVTNDQAYDLVDTQSLRAQGFRVGEVPGACFCCKFNDLVDTINALSNEEVPEFIVAEPVGSCTDLVATVIEPLRQLYGDRFDVGPLAVLLKPEHGRKILRGDPSSGFSPKAAYIFLKQVEEADIVAVNKIDKLDESERDELIGLVRSRFPDKEIYAISAQQGDGFDLLIAGLQRGGVKHDSMMHVDYDVYAEGEAELGWLNCTVNLRDENGTMHLDELLIELVTDMQQALLAAEAEPAHVKVFGHADGQVGIANLVGSEAGVDLSRPSGANSSRVEITINARVVADPEVLEHLVTGAVESLAERRQLAFEVRNMQRFRPGRPVPTHRVTE